MMALAATPQGLSLRTQSHKHSAPSATRPLPLRRARCFVAATGDVESSSAARTVTLAAEPQPQPTASSDETQLLLQQAYEKGYQAGLKAAASQQAPGTTIVCHV